MQFVTGFRRLERFNCRSVVFISMNQILFCCWSARSIGDDPPCLRPPAIATALAGIADAHRADLVVSSMPGSFRLLRSPSDSHRLDRAGRARQGRDHVAMGVGEHLDLDMAAIAAATHFSSNTWSSPNAEGCSRRWAPRQGLLEAGRALHPAGQHTLPFRQRLHVPRLFLDGEHRGPVAGSLIKVQQLKKLFLDPDSSPPDDM